MTATARTPTDWDHLPHAAAIDAVLTRAAAFTDDEAQALAAFGDAAPRDGVRDAVRDAAWAAARAAARHFDWDSARDSDWDSVWDSAWDFVWAAVIALVVLDLVAGDLAGQHGLTRDHIEALWAPWHAVTGQELPSWTSP